MSLNDKARAALRRELAKAFPERPENDPGHDRLAAALSDTARHTQGDWLVSGSFITNDSGTAVIAKVANTADTHLVWQCSTASLENSANARLIAAAPKLLEACKALLRMMDGLPWQLRDAAYKAFNERTGGLPGSLPSPISKGRAAIAKAEGGAK